MKYLATLAFLCVYSFSMTAQTTSIKRSAKIHENKKYIITETVFEDGHKEQFITSVPLAETKKMRTKDLFGQMKNVEWDENAEMEGFQKTCDGLSSIENAFNNALTNTERQLGLSEGSFSQIELDSDFLNKDEAGQTLTLINKIVESFSSSDQYQELLPLEAIDQKLSADAAQLARNVLASGTADDQTSAQRIGYRNIEFSEHVRNDGMFLSNGEGNIKNSHIQAIYHWVFADAYAGWYNRSLLINQHRNGGSKGLNDDYNQVGTEGFIGVGIAEGQILNSIVSNPTFDKATTVVLQLVDPLQNSKYEFQIKDIPAPFSTEVASRK